MLGILLCAAEGDEHVEDGGGAFFQAPRAVNCSMMSSSESGMTAASSNSISRDSTTPSSRRPCRIGEWVGAWM